MRTLYLDCGMGAAGDMLSAALLELFPDPQELVDQLNGIGLPNVRFVLEPSVKCGITGSQMHVHVCGAEEHAAYHTHEHEHDHPHEHHHSGIAGITHILSDHVTLPDDVRRDALAVFDLLAQAESHVHGVPVTDIHFHEVGTMDAVADIVCVCYLIRSLDVQEVLASPVRTGSGHVHCAHGILPVPAPATAYLLRDVPIYSGEIRDELCTPTGAALLKHFVTRFGDMPVLKPTAIGYGMGTKDFPAANCVRAILGETADITDSVFELSCNIDDMTGEAIGYAVGKLFECGALDVFTVPICMKKNRPGTLLCALCKTSDKEAVVQAVFRYTTTLGVRESAVDRYALLRNIETAHTPYGTVRRKVSEGYGVHRIKWEADDIARVADENDCSFAQAQHLLDSI